MSTTPPLARGALARMLGSRWRAFGRCPALHPTDPAMQCVEAPGHAGDHHCPMKVTW